MVDDPRPPQHAGTFATLKPWSSAITELRSDGLYTRGIDQTNIIRDYSYEEMVFLLLRGRRPSAAEANLLRAVIVSHVSHGITGQSTLAVREAADCRSSFLHALIAGFSVGAGDFHQGGLRAAMEELEAFARLTDHEVEAEVERRLADRRRIFGFGHRFFKQADPRAETLKRLADESGIAGPHLRIAQRIEYLLVERKGIHMNIEAAGGGILLDLGFPSAIGHVFIILGRGPMFAAAYLERLAEGRPPFPKVQVYDVTDDGGEDGFRH
jgi:citrate synthase